MTLSLKQFCLMLLWFVAFALGAGEQRRWIVTLPWQPQAQFAGVYYAKESGIFQRYGLDVEIRHKKIGRPVFDELARSESDFAIAPLVTALREREQGVPVVNIGQLSLRSTQMLIAFSSSGITSLKQLREQQNKLKVGIWELDFGTLPELFLKQQRIAPEIIPVNTDVALFLWGAVDLICAQEYNEYYQIMAAGFNPEELTVFRMRDHGFDVPEDGIYTLESTLRKDPEACLNFRRALLDGWRETAKHPDRALEFVHLYSARDSGRYDPAHQKWMLSVFLLSVTPDVPEAGVLSPQRYKSAARLLERYDVISAIPDYQAFCPQLGPAGGRK